MQIVNIHAAKTQLSRLVDQAASGEEIIIARAGKPVAWLMPLAVAPEGRRVLGRFAGQADVPADFDARLPDGVLDALDGRLCGFCWIPMFCFGRFACPGAWTQ